MSRMKNGAVVIWSLALTALVGVASMVMIFLQMKEADVNVASSDVVIDCPFYGMTIQRADIVRVEWCESLPVLSRRTNGFAAGGVRVGHFRTEEGENVRLFSYSSVGPCFCIALQTGEKVYLNLKDEDRTKELFVQIEGAR